MTPPTHTYGPQDVPVARRQCTAHSRSGERCKRTPIPFGTVCPMHGGASPNTIEAANRLRLMAAEPAWATLVELLADWDPRIQLDAAKAILDRAGFAPGLTLNVRSEPEDLSVLTTEQLRARALAVAARLAQWDAPQESSEVLEAAPGPQAALPPAPSPALSTDREEHGE